MMEITNNAPLCNVWEMLVDRLGAVEDNTTAIMDFLHLQTRHKHTLRLPYETFSGLTFCKRPIGLMVNGQFDVDGRLRASTPLDMIIVRAVQIPVFHNLEIWPIGDNHNWKAEWDNDLLQVWGSEKYSNIREIHDSATKFCLERKADLRSFCVNAENYGLDTPHPFARVAVFEALLKKRHPGLIAIGTSGVAMAKTDIGSAVALLDEIMQDLGVDPIPWIEMTLIKAETKPLALAILGQYDLKDAWGALSKEARRNIHKERHCGLSYFTNDELGDCVVSESEDEDDA